MRDPDVMSHVVLSVFKVAAAEANIPGAPPTLAPGPSSATSATLSSAAGLLWLCWALTLHR